MPTARIFFDKEKTKPLSVYKLPNEKQVNSKTGKNGGTFTLTEEDIKKLQVFGYYVEGYEPLNIDDLAYVALQSMKDK